MAKSKRYAAAKEQVDPKKVYTLDEALPLLKELATAKFDEALELHIRLGIDPKQGDQLVRGTVKLPHPTGMKMTIAVFTESDNEKAAKDAGAAIVGGDEMIKQIQTTKKVDFDLAVATPGMMKKLAPIAKILGQKGLMPNPKSETITKDVAGTVKELLGGKVSFRNDDTGNLHQIVGRKSTDDVQLKENIEAYLTAVKRAKPEAVKGTYLRTVTLATSMGPGISIQP